MTLTRIKPELELLVKKTSIAVEHHVYWQVRRDMITFVHDPLTRICFEELRTKVYLTSLEECSNVKR